jgi:hypothetical protein
MTSRYIVRRDNTDLALGREFLNRQLDWVDATFASVYSSEEDARTAANMAGFVSAFTVEAI